MLPLKALLANSPWWLMIGAALCTNLFNTVRGSTVAYFFADVVAPGELGRRIRDMGLIPGTEVSVVGRAPLQDPVALRLSGVTVTLRNKEADYILVTR